MDALRRFEKSLRMTVTLGVRVGCPPGLGRSIEYAVFPGGARIRPRLCLAVADACGNRDREIADGAAGAIELLHCASLVHDDLPCFDNAGFRRGKPSVHVAFGERLAVLTGDALIVLAFEALARGAATSPQRLATLTLIVGASVGAPRGICAGQAWECEESVDLDLYQRSKTGALFSAATMTGAAAAGWGDEAGRWRVLGEALGEAFQVADDIRDVVANQDEIGKPSGQDEVLGRPNAVHIKGLDGAIQHLKRLVGQALNSIPECPGRGQLRDQIEMETKKFLPKGLVQYAA